MMNPFGGILAIIFLLIGALSSIVNPLLGNNGSEGSLGSSQVISQGSSAGQHRVTQDELINALNDYRERYGLASLQSMPELNNLAQDWSQHMAQAGTLSHRPAGGSYYPAGWKFAAENVLKAYAGTSAQDLIKQWHNSPGHRANMQNSTITHVGVGIAYGSDGSLWATQNFAAY